MPGTADGRLAALLDPGPNGLLAYAGMRLDGRSWIVAIGTTIVRRRALLAGALAAPALGCLPGPRTPTSAAWNFIWEEQVEDDSGTDTNHLFFNQLVCQ